MKEQTTQEMVELFSNGSLEQLTQLMNRMEQTISREQLYILEHGEANDKNSDEQWEQYKADAEWHLKSWDAMKIARDKLKAA